MKDLFKWVAFIYAAFLIAGCANNERPLLEVAFEYHVPNDVPGNSMIYTSFCSPYMENVIPCGSTTIFQPQSIKERDGDAYRFGYLVSKLEVEQPRDGVISGTFTSKILHKVNVKDATGEWTGYFDSQIPLIDPKKEVKRFTLKVEDGKSIIVNGVSGSYVKVYIKPNEYSYLDKYNN